MTTPVPVTWEYFVWFGNELTYSVLAPAGDDRWELVTVINLAPHGDFWNLQAVFKRPRTQP